jgi:hypothetical protein
VFQGLKGQEPKMFTESVPHERGAVALCPECRAVRSPQQFLIRDMPDCAL